MTPHKRGPKSERNPQEEGIQKLRRENQRLTEELRKAEIVIAVLKISGRAVGVAPSEGGPRKEALMDAVTHLAPTVGVVAACDCLGLARASFYRQRPVLGPPAARTPETGSAGGPRAARSVPQPGGTPGVRAVLHEGRFQGRFPAAVQAALLDEGQYLCWIRTTGFTNRRENPASAAMSSCIRLTKAWVAPCESAELAKRFIEELSASIGFPPANSTSTPTAAGS